MKKNKQNINSEQYDANTVLKSKYKYEFEETYEAKFRFNI